MPCLNGRLPVAIDVQSMGESGGCNVAHRPIAPRSTSVLKMRHLAGIHQGMNHFPIGGVPADEQDFFLAGIHCHGFQMLPPYEGGIQGVPIRGTAGDIGPEITPLYSPSVRGGKFTHSQTSGVATDSTVLGLNGFAGSRRGSDSVVSYCALALSLGAAEREKAN